MQQRHFKLASVAQQVSIYRNVARRCAAQGFPTNQIFYGLNAGVFSDLPFVDTAVSVAEIILRKRAPVPVLVLVVVLSNHLDKRLCVIKVEHLLARAGTL